MKKKINEKKNKNDELWFNWLTRNFDSYEAFTDFDAGKNPEVVANNFLSLHSIAISEVIEKFDDEDKYTLEQFQKLIECEWHVFRILRNQIESRKKITLVDFKKRKKL